MDAPSPQRLTAASEATLRKLRRTVKGAGGFALYFVLAAGHARGEFLRRVEAWERLDQFPRCWRARGGAEGVGDVAETLDQLDRMEPVEAWLIAGGDALATPAGEATLQRLNADRDRLPTRVEGPLIIVLAPESLAAWRRHAPDLYSVRRGSYELTVEGAAAPPSGAGHVAPPRDRDDARVERLWQSAQRLHELERGGDGLSALSDGWRELGESYEAAGATDLASLAFDDAIRLAQEVGYDRGVVLALLEKAELHGFSPPEEREPWLHEALALATANGWRFETLRAWIRLAECSKKRGETREALHTLRVECLPLATGEGEAAFVRHRMGELLELRGERAEALRELRAARDEFARLNARKLLAQAELDIAEIDMAESRLDDARRALKERVLPAFDALGDLHGRATALKQLARIDEHEGRREEALKLLLEEVIPTFERINDHHCAAMARRTAAETFEHLGEPERAIALLEADVLPVNDRHGAELTRADNLLYLARLHGDRGAVTEALRLLREEVIPAAERLDARDHVVKAHTLVEKLRARQRALH